MPGFLQAQEQWGGEISYNYVSSTSNPHRYEVILVLFKSKESIAQSNLTGSVSSTCYSEQSLIFKPFVPNVHAQQADPFGGVRWLSNTSCTDTLLPDSVQVLAYFFRDTVDLQGACLDFKFSYESCCRDSTIINLLNPGSTYFHVLAELNNLRGPNSSPSFLNAPRFTFCKDIYAHIPSHVIEPDGDSISFSLVPALDSSSALAVYAPGFSALSPVPSATPPTNYSFNPSTLGMYNWVIAAEEYRHDTIFGLFYRIGISMRDLKILVTDSCPASLLSHAFGGIDTLMVVTRAKCGDTIIRFKTELFDIRTLTSDGSQFLLVNANAVLQPVTHGGYYSSGLYSDSIWLRLHRQITVGDTMLIQYKSSTGYALLNPCGHAFSSPDLGLIILDSCATFNTEELEELPFSMYPNPTLTTIYIDITAGIQSANFSLFDAQGRKLHQFESSESKVEITLGDFPNGVYILNIEIQGQRFSRRIQKM